MEHASDLADDDLAKIVWEKTKRPVARGEAGHLRELGSVLTDRHATAVERARSYERSLAHLMRALALSPGRDNVAQLLELLNEQRTSTTSPGLRLPAIASFLAEGQRVADLAELVFDGRALDRPTELRACLFHELVLRGVDIEDFLPLRFWPLGRAGYHPLSWLPVDRRAFEADADFPSRSTHGGAGGMDTGIPGEGRMDPPVPRTTVRSALRDTATSERYEQVTAAVTAGGWGACGAWVFDLDAPAAPEDIPALLPTLPLGCLDGLGPTDRFEIALRPLDAVWRLLFATASMGGMYSDGAHGAYGRFAAWQSLAGLTGAPRSADADEVAQRALHSTWFHFEADAEWFHNEIYDYGLACLSPDRRRLAILAASDTD
ncbi:DUF6183 family protein [Streptomyces yunnanensis]|uniref:Uncharacterized protein n=1 Tax=Streptomyces yunnanensis TaxID=156453 RepID=A0A9X8MQF2_9ACTN|nr:DUF6183 family protein [Streptomyces yunnanensis]SHL43604.1 hypothetical protein SAMN05216268_104301 [Streptomyces yunnanensis]